MIHALVAAVTPLVLIVSGSNPTPIVAGQTPPTWLHGQFSNGDDVEMVPYLAGAWPIVGTYHLGPSVADGVANTLAMQNAALAAGTPLTIMGTSQGALVIDQVIAADVAAGVGRDKVSFVVIEDPDRGSGILTFFRGVTLPFLDYKPIKPAESPYDTTVVTVEYDGVADAPTNPWNLLADVNAVLGQYQHQSSVFTDLSTVPAANITRTTNSLGGVTTTYLVPTPEVPIVWALRKIGVSGPILTVLNTILKPIIDSAYAGRLQLDAENAAAAKAATTAAVATTVALPTAGTETTARSPQRRSALAKPQRAHVKTKPSAAQRSASDHRAPAGHRDARAHNAGRVRQPATAP